MAWTPYATRSLFCTDLRSIDHDNRVQWFCIWGAQMEEKQDDERDPQLIEWRILDSVKLLSKGINALVRLQVTIMGVRARLRNEISVFKSEYPQTMQDDLLYALIKDDALPLEEILIAFDLNKPRFERKIARIQKEKQK